MLPKTMKPPYSREGLLSTFERLPGTGTGLPQAQDG